MSGDRTHDQIPRVWGRVPPRNKDFTDREPVLERLREEFRRTAATAILPRALRGMGGVGKTQIAIEYAWRYRHEYDLVWWVSADQPMLVRAALASLAAPLGLPGVASTGIDDAATGVLDALRRGEPFGRWLVVFDNADHPEDLQEMLPTGPGHVLLTSRNQSWSAVVDTLEIDVFDRKSSVEFLRKRVGAGLSGPDAALLAERLGDLPLALEQAASLQRETGMPVEDYVRLLDEQPAGLLAEGSPAEYPTSTTSALALSIARLGEQLPEAVVLLRVMAYFGPDPIPINVFRHSAYGNAAGMLNRVLDDVILRARVMRTLGRFALARIDTAGRTVQVHRLVQALLREEQPADEQAQFRHQVHLLLANAAPTDPGDPGTWPLFRQLAVHTIPADVAECTDARVRRFAVRTANYLLLSGRPRSAREFAQTMLQRWHDTSEEDEDSLRMQATLANAERELGDYRRSAERLETVLARTQALLGDENELALSSRRAWGTSVRMLGDFAGALQTHERLGEICGRVYGAGDPVALRVAAEVAIGRGLLGDHRQAAQSLEELVHLFGDLDSTGAVEFAFFGRWLIWAQRLAGQGQLARQFAAGLVDWAHETLGEDHPATHQVTRELSLALRDVGDLGEALRLAEQVLEASRRSLNAGDPHTIAAAFGVADVLRLTGRCEAALEVAEGHSPPWLHPFDDNHPFRIACAGNSALLRRDLGHLDEARQMSRDVFASLQARLGGSHPYTLAAGLNLAGDIAASGDVDAAIGLGEGTLTGLTRRLGQEHPLTLACAVNLAADRRHLGGAVPEGLSMDEVIARFGDVLGRDHPSVQGAEAGTRMTAWFDFPPL